MIEELQIRGLGVIEDVTVGLSPGLTVVTGETGAGKTMLVTALQLLLGARADTALVRSGAERASIDMVLCPAPAGAESWAEHDALVVSREIAAQGRSGARLGGRPVPVATLSEVVGPLVEIHAQHEHVRLTRPAVQRELLDRYAGGDHARELTAYRAAYAAWQEVTARRERLLTDARERARELDRLRFELDEIAAAEVDPSADADLESRIDRFANAEDIRLGGAGAAEALGSEGAVEMVGAGLDALRRLPVDDEVVTELRDRAAALAAELTELAVDVRGYAEAVEADPAVLAELQERKQLLSGLQRKYGERLEDVMGYAVDAHRRLTALEADDADAAAADDDVRGARTALDEAAVAVRAGRATAAGHLAEVVDGHLAELGMPHARARIAVEPTEPGPDGADGVTFLLAPNPGEPPRPIADAVSGGERSRTSLAIEVALADVEDARVLVFDEVDAGVGGATAMAVGEKLARLAASDGPRPRQVLCVTHLAQIAAYADVHHVVEKDLVDGRTVTTARTVDADARVAELARMLGGAVREAGVEHARELITDAAARRAG